MSHSRTFADLLTEYMARTGIGDAELARRINVNRLTLIRWREGVTERPRHRDDVARCADVLRLTPEERDEFLLAAGFEPDSPVAASPTGDDSDGDAVEEETGADRAIQPSTAQFPLNQKWTLAVAAVAVVVLLGAGLALVTDNLNLIDPDPTPIPASPTAIATYTPAATSTPTPAIPTATPLPATVARDGESLILLAPFANYTAGAPGLRVTTFQGGFRSESMPSCIFPGWQTRAHSCGRTPSEQKARRGASPRGPARCSQSGASTTADAFWPGSRLPKVRVERSDNPSSTLHPHPRNSRRPSM